MARMPRGEPRTVPDPAGDQYEEMILRERARKERAEAVAARGPFQRVPFYSPDEESRVDYFNRLPPPTPTVRIGDKTYVQVDNGRANVLVPAGDPRVSPAELAERRRILARNSFMLANPLAGAAYGLATLANAPQAARDGALLAGGVAGTVLGGVPRGAPFRAEPPPQGQLAPPILQRPNSRY